MGGSDSTQTTQSQQVTQLPPWINDAAQQNYAFAQNVATQPLQQYQGQMVADVSPQQQQAWNTAASGGNAGQSQYNAAQAGFLGVLGQQPQQIGAPSQSTLAGYMNPYTSDVINATLPIMQQQLGLSQDQQQNAASSANAYGGSRQAIQQGVTQAQGAQNMGQMAAQLNQANFGQAMTNAQQAALANQAVQQNQAGLNIQASQGLGVLGQQAQQAQAQNFLEQMTAGSSEQQQAQNQINAQMAKFQQAQQYPYNQLGVLQSALGMTPYGNATQGQSTTETQQSANPLGMALGGMQALGGLFGGGGLFGAGGAMAGIVPTSDRRLKTDITKLGVHKPSGLPIYAYRYKGDPKSYPKVAGPMAEDVAKIAPHMVAPIPGSGGKMAVHPAVMGALAGPASSARRRLPGLTPGPRGGAGPVGLPPGGFGMGPPVPGALAGPGVAGAIGSLGGSMRARQPRLGAFGG